MVGLGSPGHALGLQGEDSGCWCRSPTYSLNDAKSGGPLVGCRGKAAEEGGS